MSLQKFQLMLKNKALFFCRADKFSDPFEGSIPKKEAEHRRKSYGIDDGISNFHKRLKGQFLVNCWHINNKENDLMWRLYLKNNDGVAIKTTIGKLLESFSKTEEEISCSVVRYIDYEKDIWLPPTTDNGYNMLIPILHKREEFSDENEFRLIHQIEYHNQETEQYWAQQTQKKRQNIKVELSKFIDTIFTAPTSNENQIMKVKQIIRKNGFDFSVKKSKLDNEPYY